MAQEGAVERQVHARRHDAEGPRLGAEVGTGRLWRAARRVEVAQRGQGEGPAARAVRQRLLHHAEIVVRPHPADERRRDVVEPGLVEGHHHVDVGTGLRLQPREDREIAAVPAVDHAGAVVVLQHGHRSGPPLDAAHGRQEQGRQLRVAQGVGADRQAVLVVEEPEGRLLTRSEEVRFVGDAAQPGDEMRQPAAGAGHDVEQAGAAREQYLGAHHLDVVGRQPAQAEPGLGQAVQRAVAVGHSGAIRSSGARSNHKNPYGGSVIV